MRSKQYLNYIKSLGDRRLYTYALNEVNRIMQFEQQYGVDIDECIDDENKINSVFDTTVV